MASESWCAPEDGFFAPASGLAHERHQGHWHAEPYGHNFSARRRVLRLNKE